ncbi:hypothetical protein R69619_07813 [Paraburkholderia nemoris]|uniref:Uncharacterized protein n=1 Tax=Paraburkholderia nemoris TaxID=2793076 RepID=A0ABM8T2F0_9BURK|nr:hypothetical protein R69776_07528 [Paraburkholderia nemoris]CAE6858817.1 hypothetical protein R69619_07813 [Paraburkholderia nemoris]
MRAIRSRHPMVTTVPNFSRGQEEEVFPRIAIKLYWLCLRLWMSGKRASPPDTRSTQVSAMISPITAFRPKLFG